MEIIQFFKQTQLLADLSDQQLHEIITDFVCHHYAAKDYIFFQGDPGDKLYLIQSGQVRIFINGLDGSETSVILAGRPGDVFGELAVIDGLTRSATAVAMTDTVVYTLSRERFREVMRDYPQISLNFMRILSKKVRYNTRQVDSLASLDIAKRLARKLIDLGQDYGCVEREGVRIATPLTQTDLASLIMATRESINKVLRNFRQEGYVKIDEGDIIILDADALRQLAAG